MGFFKTFKNVLTGPELGGSTTTVDDLPNIGAMNINDFFSGNDTLSSDGALGEVTYFTCLKTLSEAVGKLSIHLYDKDKKRVYDHEALLLLNGKVNPYMNSTDFKTLLEVWRNHYGNAYVYLKYNRKGTLLGLYPLDPLKVKVYVDNAGVFGNQNNLYYEYTDTNGLTYYLNSSEVIHLKGGLSLNGLVGVSVRETLASSFAGAKASQDYLSELYKSGMTAKAVLNYTGDLNSSLQKQALAKIKQFTNFKTNKTNILPLPPGMSLTPLNLKLTDSQFFELTKLGAVQIAAAFGVKPNHLNDYSKSSYSNSEAQQLSFYIETLQYILKKFEDELNTKLLTEQERKKGLSFRFNERALLRGDMKAQSDSISTYVTSATYTINEARAKAGMPSLGPVGDVVIINGSYVPLNKLGVAYEKGGGKNE